MATKSEIENLQLNKSQDLCKLAELLGYKRGAYGQLQNNNGSFVSSLTDFFDDNPGAMQAVAEWVLKHHQLDDEDECDGCGCPADECECEEDWSSCLNLV
jgi:hypothetical protein